MTINIIGEGRKNYTFLDSTDKFNLQSKIFNKHGERHEVTVGSHE